MLENYLILQDAVAAFLVNECCADMWCQSCRDGSYRTWIGLGTSLFASMENRSDLPLQQLQRQRRFMGYKRIDDDMHGVFTTNGLLLVVVFVLLEVSRQS